MNSNATDVLIIGGGPAGSTFGSLAASRGWRVTLLEKDEHPRFHIGESLLPMNLPIFDKLDVLEKIRQIGVPKLGADFSVANTGVEHKTFYFAEALGQSPDHAFEVRRSEFDQLLFEQCREAGVDTHENTKVTRVRSLADGTHEVTAVDSQGTETVWQPRFLVDASGRDTFLSSSRGWKTRNPKHASAAVFSHFRGVERRPGKDQGNISLYWFEHGWIWLIPLRDDIMSIGAVCYPDYIKTRRGSLEDFLLETLNGISEIRDRLRNATLAANVQATGNYSYLSSQMQGRGYLMIGDAFAFIDPVFSSGVYLAMSSAASGVDVADAWLNGSARRYRRQCRRHEKMMRRGIAIFSWFIYRFTTPAMRYLMSNPRNTLRVYESVISMLAGDVFHNKQVRRRLLVFKLIYSVAWLRSWRDGLAAIRRRRSGVLESREETA
ncbi:MAG: NAD(P)/FAD-dependent oxidoreductase [Gammaproteobacteria bacterium]